MAGLAAVGPVAAGNVVAERKLHLARGEAAPLAPFAGERVAQAGCLEHQRAIELDASEADRIERDRAGGNDRRCPRLVDVADRFAAIDGHDIDPVLDIAVDELELLRAPRPQLLVDLGLDAP